MRRDGETTPPTCPPSSSADPGARAGFAAAERETQLRLALEATGLSLWTIDVTTGAIMWSPAPAWLPSAPSAAADLDAFVDGVVHPDDRQHLRRALTCCDPGEVEVEFRITPADGDLRWILARGATTGADSGRPRLVGVLLDITERALARAEHRRLLQAERRASRRAGALQRVAAALSEAATTEQVAAVMVEESLRSLGVGAARVELRRPDPVPGASAGRSVQVVRSAGASQLLSGLPPIHPAAPAAVTGGAPHPPPGTRSTSATAPLIDASGGRTRVSLLLADRGRYRGRWTVAWLDGDAERPSGGPPPPLWSPVEWTSEEGLELLHALAAECSQAIDRAELYEQQRDIATVLQRTLLPSVLPEVDGAEIAARYQPGGCGVDVGGDWYDVISLPEGRTGLVIGDVEGHSAAAAAVMGQVRGALRAYAVEGSTPAIVMERVNRLLARLQVSQLVSCCYLEFAPTEGTATVVLAGHPPPLLATPSGGCDFVSAHPNLMLGVDDTTRYVETTVLLDPGAWLLLYTDGLVATIDRSLPEGLETLRAWVGGWDVDDPPEDLVERLARLAREGLPVLDDVAVLALAYRPLERAGAHRHRTVRRILPLDPTSASAARRFVGDVLSQWQLDAVVHEATLMASELVTNSVLHTSGELELALSADEERLHIEVLDQSERLPALQTPDVEAPGGRGLLIIDALADRWGVHPRGAGKAVWFEILLEAGTRALACSAPPAREMHRGP
jgi:PAS domain S-box-containing protein